MKSAVSPTAPSAIYISSAEATALFQGLVQPPPSRRTVMLWMKWQKVRSVRPTLSSVGGATYLWHRADVEKLQARFAAGKL